MNTFFKKRIFIIIIVSVSIGILLLFFLNTPRVKLSETDKTKPLKGIIFLGIGENSKLNKAILKNSERLLGNAVMEAWNPFKPEPFPVLQTEDKKFFLTYRTNLKNKKFAEIAGENSIRVKFPYAEKYRPQYKNIILTFSNISKKPLKFRIDLFSPDTVIKELNSKYGKYEKQKANSTSFLIWEKDSSILMAEKKITKYQQKYITMYIYYIENIKNFIQKFPADTKENNIKVF